MKNPNSLTKIVAGLLVISAMTACKSKGSDTGADSAGTSAKPQTVGRPPIKEPLPELPTPDDSKPAREPWDDEALVGIDQSLKGKSLRVYVSSTAPDVSKILLRRIEECGLSRAGSDCLDAKDFFAKNELFKDRDGYAIEFEIRGFPTTHVLRFGESEIFVKLNNEVVGTIVLDPDPPKFPAHAMNHIRFYHMAKRALDFAYRQIALDPRSPLFCEKCDVLKAMQMQFKDALNVELAPVAGVAFSKYEDAVITLAFDNGLTEADLQKFIEALGSKGSESPFGKALVLNAHPDRVELKRQVMLWVQNSNGAYRGIGMVAIGKTVLTLDDEIFVIRNLFGLPGVRLEAVKILRRTNLTDLHVDAIEEFAPLDLRIEFMRKIDSPKSVGVLASTVREPNAMVFRLDAARALNQISQQGNAAAAARDAINALVVEIEDAEIVKALTGK